MPKHAVDTKAQDIATETLDFRTGDPLCIAIVAPPTRPATDDIVIRLATLSISSIVTVSDDYELTISVVAIKMQAHG